MDFLKIKDKILGKSEGANYPDEFTEDYIEIGAEDMEGKSKIIVRPFTVEEFGDIKPALDSLREGFTIALINIRPIKERDLIELKRTVNKLKKTSEAIGGDIAGFGEDWLVVTPCFAPVHRKEDLPELEE